MEINTEVNKVFGTEIAKLYARTISEETIISEADYGIGPNDSEIEKLVKVAFLGAIKDKIEEIVKTDEYQERAKKEAETILEEIEKETRAKIIDNVSNMMSGIGSYGSLSIGDIMQNMIIHEVNRRR